MKTYSILVLAMVALLVGTSTGGTYSGGSGEPNNPYQISSVADWQELMATPTDWGSHFVLTADIDLNDVAIAPVGNDANNFFGVLDGNDHIVRNADVHIPGGFYVGLFGYVGSGGQIKNLGMENVNVGTGSYVGGLVGCNFSGTITNCYLTGSVRGSYVGGLVGENEGLITGCYSTGSVKSSYTIGVAGGLVGYNGAPAGFGGLIIESYSTASVSGWPNSGGVGGLVGSNHAFSDIIRCYSTGVISGPLSGYGAGGLVGRCDMPTAIVDASFWDIQTSGQPTSAGGTGKTTTEMQDPNTFRAAGWDFVGGGDGPSDIWAMPAGGGYPILWWQLQPLPPLPAFSGGSGTPTDPYVIATPADINSIGYNPRLMDKHFVLIQDINMSQERFYIIGTYPHLFTGIFDGKGKRIWNFTWDSNGINNVGLFGAVGSGGQIKNLGMENVDVNALNGNGVGGLVGINHYGTITNCYVTGSVRGVLAVGGLAAGNLGTITNCYSTASVSGTMHYVGGLVAENRGTVTASFWDIETSGLSGSAGGTGKTTAEMKTKNTFTGAGWDFVGETANGTNDYWRMCVDGVYYPVFNGQFVSGDFACPDGVDFTDYAILASAWLSKLGEADWNAACDISQPKDNFIDEFDLAIFCENWLTPP